MKAPCRINNSIQLFVKNSNTTKLAPHRDIEIVTVVREAGRVTFSFDLAHDLNSPHGRA